MPLSDQLRVKLKSMGVDPDNMMQRMRSYVGTEGQAFKTPQDYAEAIQTRQAAGTPLQDPQMAAQFQKMAPQMFGGEAPKPYTEFPFNVGEIPEGLMDVDPKAHSMLSAMAQYQQENPFTVPYAPGTPTIAQTEAERGARQWEQTFEEGTRQFDLAHALSQRQQEHREWLDRQNLALARAAAAARAAAGSGGPALPMSGPGSPWGAIDSAIELGFNAPELAAYVTDPRNLGVYKQYGWGKDDALDYALGRFEQTWSGISDREHSLVHYSDDPRTMHDKARAADSMLDTLSGLRGGFTEADYRHFAGETGRPVDEVMRMDQHGWLDNFMQDYYGAQYKPAPSPSRVDPWEYYGIHGEFPAGYKK